MKTNLLLFLMALLLANFPMMAQDYAGDFSWAGNIVTGSSTTVRACGVSNTIRLSSSPAPHSNVSNSAAFPNTVSDPTSPITITLRFSQPVCNLRLKIDDLDFGPANGTSPVETMTPSPTIVGITPSVSPPGPTFVNVGGTLTPPVGVNNTIGWVEFGSTPLNSVTIRYDRTPLYWAFFDSLTYDCCVSCGCNNDKNELKGETAININGSTGAKVNINSAGVPIKKLNIAIPYYRSLAGPSCIQCQNDPTLVSQYGKILNLPTIAGVTPSFTGTTSGAVGSGELVYEFPTPIVLNHSVELKLQFPPTNSRCRNFVEYCIKLDLIDVNCRICEQLLCISPRSVITPILSRDANNKAFQDGQAASKMLIMPNPASTTVTVTLPSAADGMLEILDLNGKSIRTEMVNATNVELNIEALKQGTYILQYTAGDQVLTEQFVKK